MSWLQFVSVCISLTVFTVNAGPVSFNGVNYNGVVVSIDGNVPSNHCAYVISNLEVSYLKYI